MTTELFKHSKRKSKCHPLTKHIEDFTDDDL